MVYAVDNERLDVANAADLSAVIAAAIDEHFRTADPQQPRLCGYDVINRHFSAMFAPFLEESPATGNPCGLGGQGKE